MPRNRTVRVAVLGSSVQRAASSGFSSTRSGAVRRRIVVGLLVVLSLVLITLSFRTSALDPAESAGATALRPFEIAANRVARPFRDAAGWTSGLIHAKSENAKLHRQVEAYRRELSRQQAYGNENRVLRQELHYRDSLANTFVTWPTSPSGVITTSCGAMPSFEPAAIATVWS